MSQADEDEADFFGYGVRDLSAWIQRQVCPPVVMPPGYVIMSAQPGAVNYWRRLYLNYAEVPRPLAQLVAFEASSTAEIPKQGSL